LAQAAIQEPGNYAFVHPNADVLNGGRPVFRAINGTVSSGPSDSWITPDGAYLYLIYGNASKLVDYATHRDGSLTEITSVKIPYNCPQGFAGF
jgi:hypothetical protein